MEKFKLIEALEAAAESTGWAFIFSIDSYMRSTRTAQSFENGQNVLVVDVKYKPTYGGSSVTGVVYTCLMMLGRKFDSDGVGASLDEYDREKFDRRLNELAQSLAEFMGVVACDNGLELSPGTIQFGKNMFADNIDFAFSNNVTFTQD